MTLFDILHDLFSHAQVAQTVTEPTPAAAPTGILSALPLAIKAVAPKLTAAQAQSWADAFVAPMTAAQINTPKRCAAFLGQMAVESAEFTATREDLNYTAARLVAVWPSRFSSIAAATPYARNPKALADKVYNGRMGNVVGTDDGYTFRGNGPIQLTGRASHAALGQTVGKTAEETADWIQTPEGAAASAVWYWTVRVLNPLADAWNIDAITKKVNGGMTGADQRDEFSAEELKVFQA